MKKLTTATIATLGLVTAGIAIQGEADAAEQAQWITSYNTTYSEMTHDYVTIDNLGNRHHTLDGNWDPSMFQNDAYYSQYVDEEGHTHYIYYLTDNDYSLNQSHESIQANGYQGYIGQSDYVTPYQSSYNSENYNADENNTTHWSANNTNQVGYGTQNGNNTASQAPTVQAPTTNGSQNDGSANIKPASSKATGSAGWLNKYPQWQPYGQYHGGGAHYGVDYGMPVGTPVYSFTDGRVIDSGWSNYGGGNQITIQEAGTNNYQWYMHLSQLNVKKGDTVSEGQQIGLSGNTGNSTGPHLHFQRMQGGIGNQYAVNPTGYLASK
ncbi:M23 family metallopeptidase [Staphylococcus felis]|uniref:M23 family metallopeptidase n=1 Tax=Staphylococcus felis TaxID=46127 RepID=UPI0021D23289|nr:M23 family metallopeptidase [Staphylococcus felis]UXR86922.1 M23 family metallopeptidase [Staphylococcus felis]